MTASQISTRLSAARRYGFVSAYDFKVRGTGDDIGYIEEAVDFIYNHSLGSTLKFPNIGSQQMIHKISRPWIVGGTPISASEALTYSAQPDKGGKSFDLNQYQIGGSTYPLNIEFGNRVYLQPSFKPTEELTPVMSYCCSAYMHRGRNTQTTKISGLKIIGQGGLDYNKSGHGTKQVGLLMTGGNKVSFDNCSFYGLEEGFIHNSCTHSVMQMMSFTNCGRGFTSVKSHATVGRLFEADHCGTAYEIKSGSCSFLGMHSEQCHEGLIVGSGFNFFAGLYLENLGAGDYQMKIGYDEGSEEVMGTVIGGGLTCTAAPVFDETGKYTPGKGIQMRNTARDLTVIGANAASTLIQTESPLNKIRFIAGQVDDQYLTKHMAQKGELTIN